MALCALSPTLELVRARHRESLSSMWTNRSDPVLGPLLSGPGGVRAGSFIDTMLRADVHSPLFSAFAEERYPPSDAGSQGI